MAHTQHCDSLEARWPKNDPRRVVVRFLRAVDAQLQKRADTTLDACLAETLNALLAATSTQQEVNALLPLIEQTLLTKEQELRNLAVPVLDWLRVQGAALPTILAKLREGLTQRDENVVYHCARVLETLVLAGAVPFDPLIAARLEETTHSKSRFLRQIASRTLSELHRRSGSEPALEVHAAATQERGSYWRIEVSHRRILALDGASVEERELRSVAPSKPICGVCGSQQLSCVFALNDSGTGWRQYFAEYRCDDCGKFTLYHYDD